MQEYDQIANWYLKNRNPSIGVDDILKFLNQIPKGSTILDLGCGNGIPISKAIIDSGYILYGIDSSQKMIGQFYLNFPEVSTQCTSILNSDFFNIQFDAIIAYGLMFHLQKDEQIKLISKASANLKNGGKLFFNSGNIDDQSISEMNGIQIPQYSLTSAKYLKVLEDCELRLTHDHPDGFGGHIYISEKNLKN